MTMDMKTRRRRSPENNAEIRVRLNAKTKGKAAKLFRRYGLSTGDGVRLLIDQAIRAKEIPHIPNAETQKALRDENLVEISPSDLSRMILGDA